MNIFTHIRNGRVWWNISHARIFRCFRKTKWSFYDSMDNVDDIPLNGSNNNNNNGNNNDICSDNIVCSTPRGRGRQSNRSIRSPSPMPTRARSPKPSLCRHARLANDGAPQEIWHHATGSPTIVRNNIDATDIDDIDNHNNKNKNNNNNNNEEEEEELHPRQRLYFGHM